MQFQVPQFIETEDKIVGPLTLKQFAYVGIGVIVSAIFYFMLQTWIWAIITFFVMALVIALAFVKVEGRPFVNVVLSAFNFYWKPQTYVWRPANSVIEKKSEASEENESGLAKILAGSASHKQAPTQPLAAAALSREKVSVGESLHKSWEEVQTGAAIQKNSDRQFLEKKMSERYQIFQRISGDRNAAKRIDYR